MKKLLVVYHSQSGAAARLTQAVAGGARLEEGIEVCVLRTWDASATALRGADALILVAAENSASVSGAMKDFLDRTFYPCQELNIPYGVIISAGNDGRGALAQVQRICSGYPLRQVADGQIHRGEPDAAALAAAAELGQTLAAGLSLGIF